MGNTTLMEDFRRLGLSENESAPLAKMMGEGVEDADEESDALDIINLYKTEAKKGKKKGGKGSAGKRAAKAGLKKRGPVKLVKTHRLKGMKKLQAQHQARTAGSKAYKAGYKLGQKTASKTQKAKHAALIGRKSGKKGFRRVMSWREYEGPSLSEELIQNLNILAESIDVDPSERFEKFVEAFNHIADLGELLTLKYHEMEDQEMATEMAQLASAAESVLESMEDLDGAIDPETDAQLEDILADAMEDVSEALDFYGEVLNEQGGEDEEEDVCPDCEEDPCVCDDEEDEEDMDEDVDSDDDDLDESDESDEPDRLSVMIEAAKKAAKKVAKSKGKSKGKSKVSAWEKGLAKGRKDIKDPDALGGWIQHYGSFNKKTGRGARQGKKSKKR